MNTLHEVTRVGVFETNSSSSHSISVCTDGKFAKPNFFKDSDGSITIFDGEFGWGIDTFNDAASKASYCATYAFGRSAQQNVLRQVIAKHLNVSPDSIKFHYDGGYIDHQSSETADDVFSDVESLEAFIFNPGSELHIDNDNH